MQLTPQSAPSTLPSLRGRLSSLLRLDAWTMGVSAIALLIALPVLVVLSSIFVGSGDVWSHLASTVLGRYVFNSLALMLGVGFGVIVIGVATAWLVTMCRFHGSGWLEWALLLPLAAPAYILAYIYTELLDFYGPVQSGLRAFFGWQGARDYWFPDVRSLPGAMILLTLVLYPYVYLLARVAFLEQSVCTLEASRVLGCSPWRSFLQVAVPLARPAIAAGTALALMETLNDYGTVAYFGVDTFTTGIYRAWFGMGNQPAAAQLAAVLMLFVAGLVLLEQWFRRQSRFYQSRGTHQQIPRYILRGWRQAIALLVCGIPLALGFFVPAAFLLQMSLQNLYQFGEAQFWNFAGNSLALSTITAVLGVAIALFMAYGVRLNSNLTMILSTRFAAMGYAVPGSVIAVGVLVPVGAFDNTLDAWMQQHFGISTGLLLSGTIAVLIFAYLVRFLAVAFNTADSSLGRIKPSLDDASRSLGQTSFGTLLNVHTPLMTSGLLTASLLVFVDVMKELPATLIVRPFNFDTLAIRVFHLASDERLVEAAAPALAIVLVGMLPVILLSRQISQSRS